MSTLPEDMRHYAAALGVALEKAIAAALRQIETGRVALLYSAGLDSAVVARICQDIGWKPLLLSIGTADCRDRQLVERSQADVDLPVQFITVGEDDVVRLLPVVQELLQDTGLADDPLHLSLGVATYLACQVSSHKGIRLLLSGQGADTLLAGFDKYRDVPAEQLPVLLEMYLQNALRSGPVRDQAIAACFSIDFVTPFLAPAVVKLALEIPVECKVGVEGNKLVLRKLARQRGLPDAVVQRPKRAMQYSTGIWKIVQRRMQNLGER
ncbi:MAG: asparagine synthase [Anaerolineae bacterium]|nr:asparagine synthase [Anaerolineae bacterium]